MRIVALVPGGIGNQILFFPTLDDLQQSYPEAQIDVVVEPQAKGAYRVSKSVGEVLAFDFKDRNGMADWGNLLGVLRDREYDVAIYSDSRWGIGFLLWLTGIPTRIGYAGSGVSIFFTHQVPLKTEQYAGDKYHDLLQGLEIYSPAPAIAVRVPKSDLDWAETQQKKLGIASGYILIDSGVKDSGDSYPTKKWLQIIQDIQTRQPNLPIAAVQSAENRESVAALLQSFPTLKVISPEDIGKLSAIIASANLLLTTNSDRLSLAVAVGTYTISLLGGKDLKQVLSPSDRLRTIQSPTSAIADIAPQDVLEQIWK